ncbi:hypothetical protein AB0875_12735 [Micromonospora gifhornensis]|uniref:hypothetical protein n=1 Tax=Micromonospora gifhornensis TaxID=84594 RepID=UPI0034534640
MTQPVGTPQGPWHPTQQPTVFPAQTLDVTVPDLPCGHIPGDAHDDQCRFWWGVAAGEFAAPVITLPPHAPGLTPLTDPALREVA